MPETGVPVTDGDVTGRAGVRPKRAERERERSSGGMLKETMHTRRRANTKHPRTEY